MRFKSLIKLFDNGMAGTTNTNLKALIAKYLLCLNFIFGQKSDTN